jgi:hypothetical protein
MKHKRDPIRDHKQAAKQLLRAYKAGAAGAKARVQHHIRSARPAHGGEPVGLQKCQHVIAKELGYESWMDMLDEERI